MYAIPQQNNLLSLLDFAWEKLDANEFKIFFHLSRQPKKETTTTCQALAKTCNLDWKTTKKVLNSLSEKLIIEIATVDRKISIQLLDGENSHWDFWRQPKNSEIDQTLEANADNASEPCLQKSTVGKFRSEKSQQPEEQQVSTEPPLKGVPVDSFAAAAVEDELAKKRRMKQSPKTETKNQPTLEEKLEQCRQSGYSATSFVEGSQTKVQVEGKTYSLHDFLDKPLEAFAQTVFDAKDWIAKIWKEKLQKPLENMKMGDRANLLKERQKLGLPQI